MTNMRDDAGPSCPSGFRPRELIATLGPTLITAAVVIGPGTITVASKLGAGMGYAALWVVVLSTAFMWLFATTAVRVTICGKRSLLSAVASFYGRPLAVAMGILAFVVTTAFQLGNYLACAIALASLSGVRETVWIAVVGCAGLMFLMVRRLYRFAERTMSILVFAMVLAFLANMVASRPRWSEVATGLVPRIWPEQASGLIMAMVATTFSVIAAFYHGLLAKQKGWTVAELKVSRKEAGLGLALLACITMVIMITAGTVLRGAEIDSAAVLAAQFEPVLGPIAVWFFSLGFLAAAFSSVVINPMVGGGLISDGLGLGSGVDERWPRMFTAVGMVLGVGFAYITFAAGTAIEGIVLAQRSTIIVVPLSAIVLAVLANDSRIVGAYRNGWLANLMTLAAIGFLVSMAIRQITSLK